MTFRPLLLVAFLALIAAAATPHAAASSLPFDTVFKGRSQFDKLVAQADKWKGLPIGDRVAAVGKAMTGTPYRSYTLEIDDHIEAPSVNMAGLDCWTFFETSLAFARMLDEPKENWTPQTMLKYIEADRYRGGKCDGTYLSRLHYLEDWLRDNNSRGLVRDMTRDLGGVPAAHDAIEMTHNWRSYRYMKHDPSNRAGIARMEARVASEPFYYITKSQVAGIESKLQSGDIICICSHDGRLIGTSHVGLIYKADGTAHFMHASAPHNYGKVVLDQRISGYLAHFHSDAGIMVARPLK